MPAGSPTVMPIRGFNVLVVSCLQRSRPSAHAVQLAMMAARPTASGGAAVAAAGGIRAAAVIGAARVRDPFAVRELVPQAALQPTALARQLRRIEAQLLLLRHLDGDRLERPQPRGAAERTAARPVPAQPLGLVADADLPHPDAQAERRREIAHELPEVHTRFGRVIEDEARAVERVLDLRQLHRQPALADLQLSHAMGLDLPLLLSQLLDDVVARRTAQDDLRRVLGRL